MTCRPSATGATWLALPLMLVALCSCGGGSSAGGATAKTASMRGIAYGGRQPIANSTVTAYEAGLASGQAATQIGQATTDGHGNFNIATFSPVPATGQLVYLVVQGGDAGGGINPAIQLLTVAGVYCDSTIPDCTFPATVDVDELTTVAATSALQKQISIAGCAAITGNTLSGQCLAIPGFGGGAGGLAQLANVFAALANAGTGQASAFLTSPGSGASVALTLRKLDSLADLLASCVNSPGGSAGDGSACGNLFQLAGNAPDTLTAAFQIASSPVYNARGDALYALLAAPLVYTPTLTAAPANWAVSGQQPNAFLASSAGLDDYTVDSNTGAWTALASAGITTPQTAVVVDPLGRFVYYAGSVSGSKSLSLASIDPATGTLTLQPAASVDLSAFAGTTSLVIDPSGRFLYATEGTSGILSYRIDQASGALTATGSVSNATVAMVIGANGDLPSGLGFFAIGVDDGQTVTPYTLDAATGALTVQTNGILSLAVGSLHALTLDRTNHFLYITDQQKNDTVVFAVGSSGAGANAQISLSIGGPLQEGTTPLALSFDPSNRFLYIVNAGDGTVSAFSSFNKGFGNEITGSPFTLAGMSHPTSIAIDPNGHFAYVGGDNGGGGAAAVQTYAIDPTTGALSAPANGSAVTAAGAYGSSLAMDPAGKFAYLVDANNSAVLAYARDPVSGALLQQVPGSPFAPPAGTSSFFNLAVDPSGHFVLVADFQVGMWTYGIDVGTGALNLVNGSPFALNGTGPEGVGFDPSGHHVYTYNNNSSNISGLSLDPITGALSAIPGLPMGTDHFPQDGTTDPVDPFVYLASANGVIDGYAIDPVTGKLSVIPGVPFGFFCISMQITPDGRFLYCANGGVGVKVYAVDRGTGALTALALAGSPYGASDQPAKLLIDPLGRFLYGFGPNNSLILAYTIGSDGSLTAVSGSSYAISNGVSLAMDPSGSFLYVSMFQPSPYSTVTAAYAVDQITGALTPVNVPSSVALGARPVAIGLGP